QTALGTPVVLQMAERGQIERAHGRVWNTASLGERLVMAGLIDREELRQGLKVCEATGVRLGEALLSLHAVNDTELAFFLAKQAGVPYFDLGTAVPDPEVTALMPPPTGGRASYLPLYREANGSIVLAAPDPLSAGELSAASKELGVDRVRQVVVAEAAFNETLDAVFRNEFHAYSAGALMTRSPEQSARWVLNRGQQLSALLVTAALIGGVVRFPIATGTAVMALATVFYVGFSIYKFYLAYSALTHTLEIETSDEEVEALDERFLPVYTILVPLYEETEVLARLVRAIDRLDYPKPKLDVKLLLEEDDEETILAARQAGLPRHFQLVIVPRGQPKGKPKACNYGLIYARGDFVVIYDAEDLPERDQLKKALVAFAKGDDKLACVQAKLNYFNRDQNLLTRWFTTEYSMWFDLFLPGLDASHAPIPLGGTSNHFRTQRLRELGAWDPYNVTEDADLGARLFKVGWKTAVMDSTTYEEANSQIYNWIRQRSRWVKGYIQTYLVHMRNPVLLLRQLGLKDFFSFQMVIAGTFIGFLANPVFWVMTAGWFLFQWPWIKQIFPPVLFYLG
ncbi:MAG: glycosyltransferase, partial [Chloroflexota bacterium]|nr:glycosyltransferase [Chloroflexota bacterium]